jgi:hypothetical protein
MKGKLLIGVIPAMLFSLSAAQLRAEDTAASGGADSGAAIDCATATAEVERLEGEKQATSDKAVGGLLAITPVGLVTNAATGGDKMSDEQKAAAEEHNRQIDERIAEIKAACADAFAPAYE